jgi:hypothetical protein
MCEEEGGNSGSIQSVYNPPYNALFSTSVYCQNDAVVSEYDVLEASVSARYWYVPYVGARQFKSTIYYRQYHYLVCSGLQT